MNLGTDSWGPVDPNDPGSLQFYPNHEAHHGTLTGSDTFNVTISAEFPMDAAGKINFSGYVDRHGQVVPSDCALGTDCIPLSIRNAKPYPVVYKMDNAGVG